MNDRIRVKLERLRADYAKVSGKPFSHFYCPITFKDEDKLLCEAHIINEAFDNSSRITTLQRRDIDGFYGSRFESDFLDVQEHKKRSLAEIATDKSLSKRFGAKIFCEDDPVESLFARNGIPPQFTPINLGRVELSVPFGLKMKPAEVIASAGKRWEISIDRDLRIPMLVSAIKAAHLTLFQILGYRYALSLAGHFVGYDILGKFFEENQRKKKRDVIKSAAPFFREFANMVRPVISMPFDSLGSIDDKTFLMCVGGSGNVWGFVVFVKTAHLNHGVLMPVFEETEQSVTYLDFLRNDHSTIQVAGCRFKSDGWERDDKTMPLVWPKQGLLYPND